MSKMILKKQDIQIKNNIDTEERVDIWGGNWRMFNMEEICPYIEQWKLQHLRIGQNNEQKIMKQIENIEFPALSLLNLGGNKITSIQGFNRISLPSLTELYIWQNHIVCLRDLEKVHWPVCEKISFTDNDVKEGSVLNKMAGKRLNIIYFELSNGERKQVQDIRWMSKFQSLAFSELKIKNLNRIKQSPAFLTAIKKKYLKIHF